jgi:hypothetical protein
MSKEPEVLIFYLCIGCIENNEITVDYITSDKKGDKKEVKI